MGKSDYQGNWRGARRYRLDQEIRRKKAERQRSARLLPSIIRSLVAAFKGLPALPVAMLLLGAAGAGYTATDVPLDRWRALVPGSGCNIKGNISIDTGERIYHVPGQTYYHETIIAARHGERWFCSEAEARRAGWRKARL